MKGGLAPRCRAAIGFTCFAVVGAALALALPSRSIAQQRFREVGRLAADGGAIVVRASGSGFVELLMASPLSSAGVRIDPDSLDWWRDSAMVIAHLPAPQERGLEVQYDGPEVRGVNHFMSHESGRLGFFRVAGGAGAGMIVSVREVGGYPRAHLSVTAAQFARLAKLLQQAARVTREMTPAKAPTTAAVSDGHASAGSVVATLGRSAPAEAPAYFEFQVDRPALADPGNPAIPYPEQLRSRRVEGQVLAQFVVDTTGRVEVESFKVLKSSDDLFTEALRLSLPLLRFSPAVKEGRKVRQVVQMPVGWSVDDLYPATPDVLIMPSLPVPGDLRGKTVQLRFTVDARGTVRRVDFTSTGNAAYDGKLREHLLTYRFRPARKRDGTPVASVYLTSITL